MSMSEPDNPTDDPATTKQSDLADLDDDEFLHRWIASKQRHDVADWLAEFQARRISRSPAGPITAYRGAHDAEGMSWTTDLPTARSFARKSHAPLWRTELRPRAVLAVIETTGGWDEYVVDPARLGRVHEVTERRPPLVGAGASTTTAGQPSCSTWNGNARSTGRLSGARRGSRLPRTTTAGLDGAGDGDGMVMRCCIECGELVENQARCPEHRRVVGLSGSGVGDDAGSDAVPWF